MGGGLRGRNPEDRRGASLCHATRRRFGWRNAFQPRSASLPLISTVDGQVHSGGDLGPAHWTACLGSAFGLAKTLEALAARNVDACLEIGPASFGGAEGFALRGCRPGISIPSLLSGDDGGVDVLTAASVLYAAGADLDWECLAPQNARCVRVPTYPWHRRRLWAFDDNRSAGPMVPSCASEASKQTQDVQPIVLAEIQKRPDLSVPYVAPRTKLEADMVESWTAILRIEGIGIHDNFFELGGDSLQATILLNRLQEHLGGAVPGHVLFQVQNVNDLADYLRRHCAGAVQQRYPDEPTVSAGVLSDPAHGFVEDEGAVSIPRLARDEQADDLLSRLDELDDDEVESLLGRRAPMARTVMSDHGPTTTERPNADRRRQLEALLRKKSERSRSFPLSFAQQRLWMLDQLDPGNPVYNVPLAVRLQGNIDVDALNRTLNEVVARHESLRTRITMAEDRLVQVVEPFRRQELELVDLEHIAPETREAEAIARAAAELRRPFHLSQSPLFRVMLLRLCAADHVLVVSMHHIISDDWSMGVLFRDVALLYQSFRTDRPSPLESLPIQYADYAVWQRQRLRAPSAGAADRLLARAFARRIAA